MAGRNFTLERILETYDTAYGLKSVCLRYFNAAGATERFREDHDPETHLIPNVLSAATDRRKKCEYSAINIPHRTARPFATTFTRPIWPTRTFAPLSTFSVPALPPH